MKLHNIFLKPSIFIVTLVMLVGLISPAAFALEKPVTEAYSAVLVEQNTGMVLYSVNEDERAYPASLTKIMTAMLVIEACERGEINLYDEVTASSTFSEGLEEDGSTADIQEGEILTVEELLYCTLLVSANEACNILAEHLSGTVSEFAQLMNQRAAQLGCTGTKFTNTNGLPDSNHYSTAWDMYLITRQALTHDAFVKITSAATKSIRKTNMSEIRVLKNRNELMNPESEYYYEAAAGVKTGYTDLAGNCLSSTASSEDMNIIAVVMGVNILKEGMTDDDLSDATSFSVTRQLYEWAFSNYSYQTILAPSQTVKTVPVEMGKDADSVTVNTDSEITLLLPNDYSPEDIIWNVTLDGSGETLQAPIESGQTVGEVSLTYRDYTSKPVQLLAGSSVELSRTQKLKSDLSASFDNIWVKLAVVVVVLMIILFITFAVRSSARRRRARRKRRGR